MNNSSYHYIIIERIITIEERNIRSEGLRNLKTEENCRKIRQLFIIIIERILMIEELL